jgi:hypothetical protein
MPSQTCTRCGWVWDNNSTRNIVDICQSCRARKQSKISACIVWQGHYATDYVTPIRDDGSVVLAGLRTCHKKDCVNPAHVVKSKPNEGK